MYILLGVISESSVAEALSRERRAKEELERSENGHCFRFTLVFENEWKILFQTKLVRVCSTSCVTTLNTNMKVT